MNILDSLSHLVSRWWPLFRPDHQTLFPDGVLVGLDPGLRLAGVAVMDIRTKRLVTAVLVRNPLTRARDKDAVAWNALALEIMRVLSGYPVRKLVVEVPQVYQFREADSDDLLQLAGLDAAVAVLVALTNPGVTLVSSRPREWKGTINGDIMTERIRAELVRAGDIVQVQPCPRSLEHNVLDAAGICLKQREIQRL